MPTIQTTAMVTSQKEAQKIREALNSLSKSIGKYNELILNLEALYVGGLQICLTG